MTHYLNKKITPLTLILLSFFLISTSPAVAASVVLEGSVAASAAGTSVSAFITPSGNNRFGLVKVAYHTSGNVSSVTWGGVDITANLIKHAAHDGGGGRKILAWYYYLNPPASSAEIVVTKAGGSGLMTLIVEAWSGVDQISPYGDLTFTPDDTEETANPAVKTITAAAGKIVTDSFFMWNSGGAGSTWTLGGDQTEIQANLYDYGGGSNSGFFGSSYAPSDGSVDMTWDTDHPATNRWAMYIISLTEASADVIVRPSVKIKGSIKVRGGMRIR